MRHRTTLESLLPVSSALITYRSDTGAVQVATAAWVGIVCFGLPTLAVGLSRREGPLEKLGPEGTFVVNLPSAAFRSVRPGMVGSEVKDVPFTIVEAGAAGAPMIAECPVRIECRRGKLRSRFERESLRGEVTGLHRDDETVAQPRAGDFFRFDPLSGYAGAAPSAWGISFV